MSNISAHLAYSADCMFQSPIVPQGPPCSVNASMYPMILQILTQLRAAQSECNVRKILGTSFQSYLQGENQLRLQDNLKFHSQKQQLFNQIDALHSQLETFHRETDQLKQKRSSCKNATLQAETRIRELEYLYNGTSVLKENVLNLTKVLEKKDEIIVQKMEETKKIQEKLQETLQIFKGKDTQLEDLKDERQILKNIIELNKQAVGKLKAQNGGNQSILEQILNLTEVNNLRQVQLNEDFISHWNQCCNSLVYLKNKSKEEILEIVENLNIFKEELNKFMAQVGENRTKHQNALAEKLKTMKASLTNQIQLNKQLTIQKHELENSLADLKNEKHEMKEELKKLKDEIMNLTTEKRESEEAICSVLKENQNLKNTFTKQVQLIKDLKNENEELEGSLADLKNKTESDLCILKEELRKCMESNPSLGVCGPTQLKEIKLPEPDFGMYMYMAVLENHMPTGCLIQVTGIFNSSAEQPSINLNTGGNDIALYISVRFCEARIVRNSHLKGAWGVEEACGILPLKPGQQCTISVISAHDHFRICINGVLFARYKYRITPDLITSVFIDGFQLQKIRYFIPTII